MKRGSRAILGWGWLLAVSLFGACAQTPGNAAAVPNTSHVVVGTPEIALESDGPRRLVLQQIEDPSTGDLWLLERDSSRPGGPGRLVLARQETHTEKALSGGPAQPLSRGERPVIHTGDRLMVEEHTTVADVRLEAVALGPAVKGGHFKARLKLGGKVVRVVAVSEGRADFAPDGEVEP